MFQIFQDHLGSQLRKSIVAIAISSLFAAEGHAAGLGKLTVQSALGQPLRAEIELVTTADDSRTITAKLASFDDYRQANIEANSVLSTLRFDVATLGGRKVVRITSSRPINEPYLDLLLELHSGDDKLIREFVLLLDPPTYPYPPSVVVPIAPEATNVAHQTQATEEAGQPRRIDHAGHSGAAVKPQSGPRTATKPAYAHAGQTLVPATAKKGIPTKPGSLQVAHQNQARPAASYSRLRLSSADDPANDDLLSNHEKAVLERSVAEANNRVKLLEQKVDDMQKLLAVTNDLIRELRTQNELNGAPRKLEQGAATPHTAAAPENNKVPSVMPSAVQRPAPRQTASPQAVLPGNSHATSSDTGFLIPGLGILAIAGLSGTAYYLRRRRKRSANDSYRENESVEEHTYAVAHSTAEAPKKEEDLAITASTIGTRIPGDDPVAEADVYIAYGRDGQAERVLQEALALTPDHHAVRIKLLSMCASRNDRDSVERLARELYEITKGKGNEWEHAASIGLSIDPDNSLYKSGRRIEEHVTGTEPGILLSDEAPSIQEQALPLLPCDGETLKALETTDVASGHCETTGLPGDCAMGNVEADFMDLDFAQESAPTTEEKSMEVPAAEASQVSMAEFADIDFALQNIQAGLAESESNKPLAQPKADVSETGPIDFDFEIPLLPELERSEKT